MKTRIVNEDFEMDISSTAITIQEENSKVGDKMFSKFMFPFTVPVDEKIIEALGDFQSHETVNLQTSIDCFVENEDQVHKAKLEIMSIKGGMLTGQADYGLEELPNFNKKLSELPLQKITVEDIHTYAPTIFGKPYPQTNFNFPRMFAKKYDPEQEVWDAFNGYLNDTETDNGVVRMRKNYLDADGNIFNVNIIHPCPHLLYILREGFKDAGFILAGNITEDQNLKDAWVYSGTDYFSSKKQRRYDWVFDSANYDWLETKHGPKDYAFYEKHMSIEKPGKYKISGLVGFFKAKKLFADYVISLNGNTIWERHGDNNKQTIYDLESHINVDFNVSQPNSVLKFYIKTQYHMDWNHPMANLNVTSDALQDITSSELGDESGVVTNLNEVDLKRAVPEMTFGEFVTAVKNYFNYDIEIRGNFIYMNNNNKDNAFDAKDFQMYESSDVERNYIKNRSYLLKFPELSEKIDNMYFDAKGEKINGTENSETKVIDIRGYSMPVRIPKSNGKESGIILSDDATLVQIINYTPKFGDNTPRMELSQIFPKLFSDYWKTWLGRRLSGVEYKWSFPAYIDVFSGFNIKDYVYCYKNAHIIKMWTKEKISKNMYRVDITTETVT